MVAQVRQQCELKDSSSIGVGVHPKRSPEVKPLPTGNGNSYGTSGSEPSVGIAIPKAGRASSSSLAVVRPLSGGDSEFRSMSVDGRGQGLLSHSLRSYWIQESSSIPLALSKQGQVVSGMAASKEEGAKELCDGGVQSRTHSAAPRLSLDASRVVRSLSSGALGEGLSSSSRALLLGEQQQSGRVAHLLEGLTGKEWIMGEEKRELVPAFSSVRWWEWAQLFCAGSTFFSLVAAGCAIGYSVQQVYAITDVEYVLTLAARDAVKNMVPLPSDAL